MIIKLHPEPAPGRDLHINSKIEFKQLHKVLFNLDLVKVVFVPGQAMDLVQTFCQVYMLECEIMQSVAPRQKSIIHFYNDFSHPYENFIWL